MYSTVHTTLSDVNFDRQRAGLQLSRGRGRSSQSVVFLSAVQRSGTVYRRPFD